MPDLQDQKIRGSWIQRFLITVFSLLLALLFHGLLSFVIDDLENLKRPLYSDVKARMLSSSIIKTEPSLLKQITKRLLKVEKLDNGCSAKARAAHKSRLVNC